MERKHHDPEIKPCPPPLSSPQLSYFSKTLTLVKPHFIKKCATANPPIPAPAIRIGEDVSREVFSLMIQFRFSSLSSRRLTNGLEIMHPKDMKRCTGIDNNTRNKTRGRRAIVTRMETKHPGGFVVGIIAVELGEDGRPFGAGLEGSMPTSWSFHSIVSLLHYSAKRRSVVLSESNQQLAQMVL